MITQNLKQTQNNIAEAAKKSGRTSDDILLVAVSKTKPLSALQEAYNVGIRDFGENKVQELCDKYNQLPKDIRWHMIGHLQRNKVKYLIGKVTMIHSVDSLRLAEEISKESVKTCRRIFYWKSTVPGRRANLASARRIPSRWCGRSQFFQMSISGD